MPEALYAVTVLLDQPRADGMHTVGTGFLVKAPLPDGTARTVLVTARHVFTRMTGAEARIGYRSQDVDGAWRFTPLSLTIRSPAGEAFVSHPRRDISVIGVTAPPEFAAAAIPLSWLADSTAFERYKVRPGDEMMTLGFPQGLSSNGAGFPILRVGRVASYPLTPVAQFPRFLLDFRVFPGNSGGPVFLTPTGRASPTDAEPEPLIAGLLTEEVELKGERMEMGIITHAQFIRETIALLDLPKAEPVVAKVPEPVMATK
jgi:hypothetical protein